MKLEQRPHPRGKVYAAQFDHIGELADAIKERKLKPHRAGAGEWAGGTLESCLQACHDGRIDWASKAEKYAQSLEREIRTPQFAFVSSPEGAYPMVAEYLAGMPDCMRRKTRVSSERGLIRIYSSITVSTGLDHAQIERRGSAILALVQILSAVRPIELYTYSDLDADNGRNFNLVLCRIDTAPLDLATACYALIAPGFSRQVCMTWAEQHKFRGSWGWGQIPEPGDPKRHADVRLALEASPEDIVIDGGVYNDSLLDRDPAAWVKEQVLKHLPEDE